MKECVWSKNTRRKIYKGIKINIYYNLDKDSLGENKMKNTAGNYIIGSHNHFKHKLSKISCCAILIMLLMSLFISGAQATISHPITHQAYASDAMSVTQTGGGFQSPIAHIVVTDGTTFTFNHLITFDGSTSIAGGPSQSPETGILTTSQTVSISTLSSQTQINIALANDLVLPEKDPIRTSVSISQVSTNTVEPTVQDVKTINQESQKKLVQPPEPSKDTNDVSLEQVTSNVPVNKEKETQNIPEVIPEQIANSNQPEAILESPPQIQPDIQPSDGGTTPQIEPESQPNQPPQIPQQPTGPINGAPNTPLTYTISAVVDPEGSVVYYLFDFGDGTTSDWQTTLSIAYSWTTAGFYEVKVKAKDSIGAETLWSTALSVTIMNPPQNPPPSSQYSWNFGDESTADGAIVTHSYSSCGIYTVTLTYTDIYGHTATDSILITIIPQQIQNLNIEPLVGSLRLTWDGFSSETGVSYYKIYKDDQYYADTTDIIYIIDDQSDTTSTYKVSAVAGIDLEGPLSEGKMTGALPMMTYPPVADPGDEYFAFKGKPVVFDGTASYDPDGGSIKKYAWNFGDGITGSGAKPSHTYTKVGYFTVTLTVTDDENQTDSTSVVVPVMLPNQLPVSIPGGPYQGTIGENITLNGSESYDPDGTIAKWSWDFGDGKTGSGKIVNHSYAKNGSFIVSLTVTDNGGSTNTNTTLVIISVGRDAPDAPVITVTQGTSPGMYIVTITSDSTDENIVYKISWGNGKITRPPVFGMGVAVTASYTYTHSGTYTIAVVAINQETGVTSEEATYTVTVDLDDIANAQTAAASLSSTNAVQSGFPISTITIILNALGVLGVVAVIRRRQKRKF
jgi:PKD repeat protein